MLFRPLLGALALTVGTTSVGAVEPWDPRHAVPTVLYFVSLPLDGITRKEREPLLGLRLQGEREYQALYLDTRLLNFVDGGISEKVLIAGAVAIGAALAVGGGGGSNGGNVQPAAPSASPGAQAPAASQPCPSTCKK